MSYLTLKINKKYGGNNMKLKKVSKKILSAVVACSIAFTSISCAFTDLSQNHWAYDAVEKMVDNNVISGYTDGTFRPNAEITRAEFATILVKTLEIKNKNTIVEFEDVEGKHWAEEFIDLANPFLTGYSIGGKYYFKPNEAALREDAAVAIVRAKGLSDEKVNENILNRFIDKNDISENLRKYVAIAVENGFMKGNVKGEFNPKGHLTRAEVAALFNNINEYEEKLVIGELEKEELPELKFDEDRRAISLSTGSTNWEKYELATESVMGGPGNWYKPYTDFKVRGGKVYLEDIGYSYKPADGKVYIRLKADPDAGYSSIRIKEEEELPELEFDEELRALSLSNGSTNWSKYEVATESAVHSGPGNWYEPYTDFEVRGGKVYLKDIGYSHQPADGRVYIRLKANPDAGYSSIRIKEDGIEMPEFDGEVVDLGADWEKFEIATDSPRGSGRPGSWYTPAGREVTLKRLYKLRGEICGDTSAENIFVRYDGEIIKEFEIEKETVYGDANEDGKIDLFDSLLILQYAQKVSEKSITNQGLKNADVNIDGKVNGTDAIIVLAIDVGREIDLPAKGIVAYGDVDEDGFLNQKDIEKLNQYVEGTISLGTQARKNADFNGDGKVNSTDISSLEAHIDSQETQTYIQVLLEPGDTVKVDD